MNRLVKAGMVACLVLWSGGSGAATPEPVHFSSADGQTQLTGYVFLPAKPGPHPAVVMLHGRGGPYSSLKRGQYTADALTLRHKMWGNFWAGQGYLALHVDSFGPRGFGDGFGKHSYSSRPLEVSEQSVRPLDAYGALAYLRSRSDVVPERIGVQGWSNGGMTVLATLGPQPPGLQNPTPASGFRAAIAQYPSCRAQAAQPDYLPYAPLLMAVAEEDDEVSPHVCRDFAEMLRNRGANLEFIWYDGAHHSYDDPGKTKQSHAPNRLALQDTRQRAAAFFAKHLRP
ncbi:MAG: prolyl oligopeptidase family serine peptidase [Burkholderiales bacterium]|nr:prolyl oligopeptidase family serine peptidase [Burkholderiales bacterium]